MSTVTEESTPFDDDSSEEGSSFPSPINNTIPLDKGSNVESYWTSMRGPGITQCLLLLSNGAKKYPFPLKRGTEKMIPRPA